MERYLCIHGHFYQPPRENPWLESIEIQDSAHPYHDWNERIDAECYAPNAAARILDTSGLIDKIVCNYDHISFDFGPTLLSWMEDKAPATYHAVLEADIESRRRFAGHGSAMAQAHSHLIMPLANRRDKTTQIIWGIRDFEFRFRRPPEGIWLPETAVDLETLDIAAEHGIQFTVLAPHQAARVRRIGDHSWKDVSGQRIDPRQAYKINLPSGKSMALFFYDGPISRSIAFEGVLRDGGQFADRIMSVYDDDSPSAQLAHVATDGETYGHHHQFGEMALAYALRSVTTNRKARVTNYGEFLERHPPTHEVEIAENTSWSCAHGVERWRSDCSCHTGGQPGWNQAWRAPLREALDLIRDFAESHFERLAGGLLSNPWQARDEYIQVVLDRNTENVDQFLTQHSQHPLDLQESVTALKLLEMQRYAMMMYTSCGWFFNEISGIETIQVLQYAGRVIQLAEELTGESLENRFLAILERAKSNIPEQSNGRHIYEEYVKPAQIQLATIGANAGIYSLFEGEIGQGRPGCFDVVQENVKVHHSGRSRLAEGRTQVDSRVTRESSSFDFVALHLGDHNVTCMVRDATREFENPLLSKVMRDAFDRGDHPAIISDMAMRSDVLTITLQSLNRDDQRHILESILKQSLAAAEDTYRQIYRDHADLMRFVTALHLPVPPAFLTAAKFVLNEEVRRTFEADVIDPSVVKKSLAEARRSGVAPDGTAIGFALGHRLNLSMEEVFASPKDLPLLERVSALAALARSLGYRIDIREAQNRCYELRQWVYPDVLEHSRRGDHQAQWWVERFRTLAEALSIRIDSE